jgi:uracil-DNA glycosylase family 4
MSVSARQQHYLKLMGIDVWLAREAQADGHAATEQLRPIADVSTEGQWQALRQQVSVCSKCVLHQGRTQTVFGSGNENAKWMLIGEAPGAEEDKQGLPFVGRAGQLLTSMLKAIGLQREQVFIANILKCRPPENRDPRPEEVLACEGYLKQQIEYIKPTIILALGRIAAQNLLKIDTPIGKMRGNLYEYPGLKIPVMVTYHPAYLLRSPKEKQKSWQDLQAAMKLFQEIQA